MKFKRITVNPKQMDGVPCIRGLRIPVATVVGMIAEGMAEEEILKAYPDLEREDIREALRFLKSEIPRPYVLLYDLFGVDERVHLNRSGLPEAIFGLANPQKLPDTWFSDV